MKIDPEVDELEPLRSTTQPQEVAAAFNTNASAGGISPFLFTAELESLARVTQYLTDKTAEGDFYAAAFEDNLSCYCGLD